MIGQELASDSKPTASLSRSLGATVRTLRAALLDLYADVGADPTAPQDVSRRYGVTKSQAWKLSKVMGTSDPVEAARYLPGRRGLDLVLEALSRHGLKPELARRAREAMGAIHEVIATHAGDRATFDRTLDSLRGSLGDDPSSMEASRKLSFQGNSATWGIQARVRLSLRVLAPTPGDPEWLDIANVSGLIDLRRLRPTARWPLAQYTTTREGEAVAEPLEPNGGGHDDAPFLTRFCSDPLPPVRKVGMQNGTRFELSDGPVGKAAAFTALFGVRFRRFASVYAGRQDEVAEHAALLRTPSEVALHDLLVHRDLPFEMPPEAHLYSQMEVEPTLTVERKLRFELPLAERIEHLGDLPPSMGTPHFARHAELAEHVVGLMGHGLEEFRAWRIMLRYPPTPTMLCLQHTLPER